MEPLPKQIYNFQLLQNEVVRVMSVKTVGDAVKQVVEKDERGMNAVMYGVPEESNQMLESCFGKILLRHVGHKSALSTVAGSDR